MKILSNLNQDIFIYAMTTKINDFQGKISGYFRELTLAVAYLQIGSSSLITGPQNAFISLKISQDITTEPKSLHELLPHGSSVEKSIFELFQMKMIAAWSDLINELFSYFVVVHMNGTKKVPEIGKKEANINFSSDIDISDQIKSSLAKSFAFGKYKDRINTIRKIFSIENQFVGQFSLIKKHVLIRNAIQHHNGKVYHDMVNELGCKQISILDQDGNSKDFELDDDICIYIPELDKLKSSLFIITNHMRDFLV